MARFRAIPAHSERPVAVDRETAMLTLTFLLFALQSDPAERRHLERDLFGVAVDAAGDLNGDGVPDLWVGDPSRRTREDSHFGKVWAISGVDGATILRIDSPGDAHDFGWTVCAFGDVDGDGARDVAIGSMLVSDTHENARDSSQPPQGGEGAVYVHSGKDSALRFVVRGPADALDIGWDTNNAGPSLVPVGDWNGDDIADLAIGWAYFDDEEQDRGRVQVVSGSDGSTLHSWIGEHAGDRLGMRVARLPDVDGDGRSELAASAIPLAQFGQKDRAGSVRVLSSKGSIRSTFHPTDGTRMFGYGLAAAVIAGENGTTMELVVGQPFGAYGSVALSRWNLHDGSLTQEIRRTRAVDWIEDDARRKSFSPERESRSSFGYRVWFVADQDHDGRDDIAVSAPESMGQLPAGVLSSATGKPIRRVDFGDGLGDASHVGIGSSALGDVDGDGIADFAVSGASARCSVCDGVVVIVSGRTLGVLRTFTRAGRE